MMLTLPVVLPFAVSYLHVGKAAREHRRVPTKEHLTNNRKRGKAELEYGSMARKGPRSGPYCHPPKRERKYSGYYI